MSAFEKAVAATPDLQGRGEHELYMAEQGFKAALALSTTRAALCDKLRAKTKELLAKNAHWKSCGDGSYEASLDSDGYYLMTDVLSYLEAL